MNLQSLVVVLLRLTALDFLFRAVVQAVPSLVSFVTAFRGTTVGERLAVIAPIGTVMVGLVICAVGLWIFAPEIAARTTKGLPNNVSLGTLTLADCYSIAFLGIGLFYLASGIPAILISVHYLSRMALSTPGNSWREKVDWYDFARGTLPFFVGIVLFVKGREWSVRLAHRQLQNETTTPQPEPQS